MRLRLPAEGRLLLPTRLSIRFLWLILLAGLLCYPVGWCYAQSSPGGQAYFVGDKNADLVGPRAARPDGKPEVAFSLTFDPQSSAQNVTGIEIRTTSGPPGFWSTDPKARTAGFIGVAESKTPSVIINKAGGPLDINPQQARALLLYVSDDGRFARKERRYRIKVTHKDGRSWAIPVSAGSGPEAEAAESRGTYPVRMSAVLKGISSYDAVGPGKEIKGDDKGDGLFVLTVEAKDKEITAIQIRNVDGVPSVWDTIPGGRSGAIGVALASEPTRLVNQRDGSVKVNIKERADLNLYVADNGGIEKGNTTYRINVTFSDGEISWCPVKKAATAPEPGARTEARSRLTVNFLATWMGYVSTDAVGPYSEMKPDGQADAVFGLDIEVLPKGEITGLEIQSLTDLGRKWATGSAQGVWGLGVAYQGSPRVLLNKLDGSIRIPMETREQFFLYAADPGNLSNPDQRLRMIVHLADGSSFQQMVSRTLTSTPTVVPGTGVPPRARGLITCEFRGFIADLVNTSTRPGKDGYSDGTFILRLKVEDKKLNRVTIKGPDGVVRWASDPRAPVMFLGVALYPKIYDLLNTKGGPLNIPVSGHKTVYLYAADNGLLSDPKSRLTVDVTFADQTTLSAEVIK